MVKVALKGAEFFGYHGYYPGEQMIGTWFIIDVKVIFHTKSALTEDKIDHTVNYEVLYAIVQAEMKNPRKLIETVVQGIINKITTDFPFINKAKVTIKKLNPALGGIVKNSAVSITYCKT